MHRHPLIGWQIIRNIPFLQEEAELIFQHHERFDGSGYPRGLKGSDIKLGARIFAVADAFDALYSDRVYRKALPLAEVLAEIHRNAGTQFDPEIVKILQEHYQEMIEFCEYHMQGVKDDKSAVNFWNKA